MLISVTLLGQREQAENKDLHPTPFSNIGVEVLVSPRKLGGFRENNCIISRSLRSFHQVLRASFGRNLRFQIGSSVLHRLGRFAV